MSRGVYSNALSPAASACTNWQFSSKPKHSLPQTFLQILAEPITNLTYFLFKSYPKYLSVLFMFVAMRYIGSLGQKNDFIHAKSLNEGNSFFGLMAPP